MEYLVRIIEAVVWPGAVLIMMFSFRSEIRKLLPQVKKFRAGPVEAEFEREISEIAESSEDLIPNIEITQQVLSVNDKLIKLARIDTRSAILEAWRNLEESLKQAILYKAGSPIPDVSSSHKVVKEAESFNLLSPREIIIVTDHKEIWRIKIRKAIHVLV